MPLGGFDRDGNEEGIARDRSVARIEAITVDRKTETDGGVLLEVIAHDDSFRDRGFLFDYSTPMVSVSRIYADFPLQKSGFVV